MNDIANNRVAAFQPKAAARGVRTVRRVLLQVHLWLALSVGVVLVAISFTGALLVWRDQIDSQLNPGRYAVTGTTVALPLSAYVANAVAAAGSDRRPVRLQMPEKPDWPIQIVMRAFAEDGKAGQMVTATLDPLTGRVLDIVDISSTLLGIVHNFHHMLSVPQYSGRQIVGWIGVVLLVVSLSGLYLWWPRRGGWRHALRWHRSNDTLTNIHHLFGIVTAVPLMIVCLTGIYLSFPATAASLMAAIAPTNAQGGHKSYGVTPVASPHMTIDAAVTAAQADVRNVRLSAIDFPATPRNATQNQHSHTTWRIAFRAKAARDPVVAMIDDASGVSRLQPAPLSGDRAITWITRLHEGREAGALWALLAFLSGLAPILFFVTGVMMWQRRNLR